MLLLLYPAWSGAEVVVETPKGAVIMGGAPSRPPRRILRLRELPEEKKPKKTLRDVIDETLRPSPEPVVQNDEEIPQVASTPIDLDKLLAPEIVVAQGPDLAAEALRLKRRRSAVLLLLLDG